MREICMYGLTRRGAWLAANPPYSTGKNAGFCYCFFSWAQGFFGSTDASAQVPVLAISPSLIR
jgi:hypothetical protein